MIEDVAKKIKEILLLKPHFKNADIQDEIKKFNIRQILLENFPEISESKLDILQESFREKVALNIKKDSKFRKKLVENFSESKWLKIFKKKWPNCENFLKEIFKNKGFKNIRLHGKGLNFIINSGLNINPNLRTRKLLISTLQKVYGENNYENIYDKIKNEIKENRGTTKCKTEKIKKVPQKIDDNIRDNIEKIYSKRTIFFKDLKKDNSVEYAGAIYNKIKDEPKMSNITKEDVLRIIQFYKIRLSRGF